MQVMSFSLTVCKLEHVVEDGSLHFIGEPGQIWVCSGLAQLWAGIYKLAGRGFRVGEIDWKIKTILTAVSCHQETWCPKSPLKGLVTAEVRSNWRALYPKTFKMGTTRVGHGLYIPVSVGILISFTISKAGCDSAVEMFYLTANLWMIGDFHQVFDAYADRGRGKRFENDL